MIARREFWPLGGRTRRTFSGNQTQVHACELCFEAEGSG
jgi:hypothetical protein